MRQRALHSSVQAAGRPSAGRSARGTVRARPAGLPERDFVPLRLWWRFCRFWVFWPFLLLFRAHVVNVSRVPRRGRVILACNHQSFFDPVFATIALTRESSYLARDSLFNNRWFGWLIRSLNAIPVRRGQADVGAIKEMLRRLLAGYVVVAFPEATRTHDGSIGPMRPGVVLLAQKARATIVPVCIEGAFEAWPRRQLLPRPGRVTVMYGEPFSPEELTGRDPDEVIVEIRDRIVDMQKRLRRPG